MTPATAAMPSMTVRREEPLVGFGAGGGSAPGARGGWPGAATGGWPQCPWGGVNPTPEGGAAPGTGSAVDTPGLGKGGGCAGLNEADVCGNAGCCRLICGGMGCAGSSMGAWAGWTILLTEPAGP